MYTPDSFHDEFVARCGRDVIPSDREGFTDWWFRSILTCPLDSRRSASGLGWSTACSTKPRSRRHPIACEIAGRDRDNLARLIREHRPDLVVTDYTIAAEASEGRTEGGSTLGLLVPRQ